MALLRLLTGQNGLAELEQDEARDVLTEEARSVNPNTGAFRAYGDAHVRLNQDAANAVLQKRQAYAPPVPELAAEEPPPEPPPRRVRHLPFELEESVVASTGTGAGAAGVACPHCDKPLPTGRAVLFCPFCGGNVTTRACPQCGTALETAWRHCVTCGYKLGG